MAEGRLLAGVLALVLFSAVLQPPCVRAEEEGEDDDLDLDIDGIDDDGSDDFDADVPGASAPPSVDDVDEALPDKEKQKRMKTCFGYSMSRLQQRREEMQQIMKEITAAQDISEDQAANNIIITWIMTCYLNIDDATAKKDLPQGPQWTEALDELIFKPQQGRPQQVQQASQKQWKLLESVVVANQKEAQRTYAGAQGAQGGQGGQGSGSQRQGPQVVGGSMSSSSSALYVFGVFGTIFGLGFLAVLKLRGPGNGDDERGERSGRAAAKQEKAERKLAKKRM